MATHWTSRTLYSFDLETTNADPEVAEVVSGTVVKVEAGQPTARRSWVSKPTQPIPDEAISIHGITNEYVEAHGRDPKAVLEDIADTLAKTIRSRSPLIVYNAPYDLSVIERECARHGVRNVRDRVGRADWSVIIDPFILARGYDTFKTSEGSWGKNYTLPEVCYRYGVPFEESHDATADAVGAAQLAIAMFERHDFLRKLNSHELWALQKDWRLRLQTGLREYFDRKKIEHDGVDEGWPMHTSLL